MDQMPVCVCRYKSGFMKVGSVVELELGRWQLTMSSQINKTALASLAWARWFDTRRVFTEFAVLGCFAHWRSARAVRPNKQAARDKKAAIKARIFSKRQ